MRSAWKTRVAGCVRRGCRGFGGTTRSTSAASSSAVAIGRDAPGVDDRPGDARRLGLLAVAPEERGQLGRVERGEQVRGGDAAGRVEAHVERAAGAEAEAALAVGQLEARQAEVEQAAVDGAEAAVGRDLGQLAEVRLAQDEPVAEARPESRLDPGDRRRIGIEAEEAAIGVGGLQDPLGVPTAAQGGIDVKAAGSGREHLDDLLHQHRQVPFVHLSSIRTNRIPSGSWKRIWSELDPQPFEGLGQLLRVVERLAVRRPTGPVPRSPRGRASRPRRPRRRGRPSSRR